MELTADSLISALVALAQVALIDVTLAGDNAVVIGMAVRALQGRERRLAILIGTGFAALIRLGLALVAARLLTVLGLTLAGGLLLLWVCWKMYRELRAEPAHETAATAPGLKRAIVNIIVADVSMSLDNVLAVAGASTRHPWILAGGLVFSVLLMGVAASFIAGLLARYRWISWAGLLVVLAVAIELIVRGGSEVWSRLP